MSKEKKPAISKGEFGYINLQKKKKTIKLFTEIAIGIAIFILGLCLNKFEKSNIFTIIAILMVLPAARTLVGIIVFLPYKSISRERVNAVKGAAAEKALIMTDVVFTSREKIMFCSFFVLVGKELYCLADHKKQDISYIETYLKDSIKKRQLPCKVYVTANEKNFLEKIRQTDVSEVSEELVEFLKSLMV